MTITSINMLFPYLTLGLLIAGVFAIRSRLILIILLAAQLVFAHLFHIIDSTGLCMVVVFWALCNLHWRFLSSNEGLNALRIILIAAIAIVFASHIIPGFHNLRVYNGLLISPTALPFTMYLNFDKTIAAVVIAITGGVFMKQANLFGLKELRDTILISAVCIALLGFLALGSGYVNFEPKYPEIFWLWAFNNLYYVCFAEEIIFRGVIQAQLARLTGGWRLSPFISIFIPAILFAATLPGHRSGGIMFMFFVTMAGMFYGYAYHRTKRLEAAILVHFFVNLAHFLLFSYPMLAR